MIKKEKDGYKYISNNGICYDLLEGMFLDSNKSKTSDIVFIVQYNGAIDNENIVVGHLYGASDFKNYPSMETCSYIEKIVAEYEKKNFGLSKIIKAIYKYLNCGYGECIELVYDVINDVEGYYIAKRNGWGLTPLTPILATYSMIKDNEELISILNELGINYCI